MNAYSLYFLLPTDIQNPPKTMDIPLAGATDDKISPTNTKNVGINKRKMPSSAATPSPEMPKGKKPKTAPFAQLQQELDALSIGTLLERMNEAVESERWERKHQLIGSTIALHAVKDATAAPEIRGQASDGGVPRTEIMKWIKESPKYSVWVKQMMSKMEAKSYQNTITKALLKAGHIRTGSGGRYIKWILQGVTLTQKDDSSDKPAGIRNERRTKDGEEEEEEEEEEEDDGKSNMDEEDDEEAEDEDADDRKGDAEDESGLEGHEMDGTGDHDGNERNNDGNVDEDATNENDNERGEGFETFEGEHESDGGEGEEGH